MLEGPRQQWAMEFIAIPTACQNDDLHWVMIFGDSRIAFSDLTFAQYILLTDTRSW